MKQFIQIILVTVLLSLLGAGDASAQCKGFAKSVCKNELGAYLHDGNYHAAVLVEGEEAELYKTFYSEMEYRMVVCAADGLPPVEFRVQDASGKELYSSSEGENSNIWDFKLEASQQLKIVVKVTTFGMKDELPASGCVAIMFGFKTK